MSKLSHLDEHGEVHMVDVGTKSPTGRRALARGHVSASSSLLGALLSGDIPKGDVLAAARVAGIMAAKQTAQLIPLCHPLGLDAVDLSLHPADDRSLRLEATTRILAKTGVEMEALTAVSVAALTIYDMCKAVDRSMVIGPIALEEKSGGRSGHYQRSQAGQTE